MTDLTEQAKPTVMVRENLSAYYFSFETTGNQDIDRILGAIAWAGKAYHHTEDWDDDDLGLSCVDNIQNAANLAAATLETLTQENARLREAGWRDIETIEAQDKCLLWCSDIRWEDQRQPEGGYKRVSCPVGVVMGSSFDYLGDGRITVHGLGMNGDWTFTHWMPLPPAPARKTLGGGDES